ncbi:hypothetical protein PpBr36_02959 [Pyricularia pennisetigena]|uniref:hypothetical protein n=1 Tax=Pyricularia pennisetigena TaxID=1578925 RepID=UPI001151C9CE|nr:hypothetical protein PpBr36_02959 [Pyricularia pennisetigena]TLS31216.1 hypothetical protein PpBr36_02959 [Pyricularia pennisetigena]
MQSTTNANNNEPVERDNFPASTEEASAALPVANGAPQDSAAVTHQASSHGYNHYPVLAPHAQNNGTESRIHPELRSPSGYLQAANMMTSVVPAPPTGAPSGTVPNAQHQPHATAGAQLLPGPPPDMGDHMGDARKSNKRELSQSKRAAQNRAAQRAFRQRKEGYIKKLEQQVQEHEGFEATLRSLQEQNYLLRGYVVQLQTHLMTTQGDCPPPPPGLTLEQHSQEGPAAAHNTAPPPPSLPATAPPAPMMSPNPQEAAPPSEPLPGAGTALEQVAQAVANLGRTEENPPESTPAYIKPPPADDDARTAEELSRQLHGETVPTASM